MPILLFRFSWHNHKAGGHRAGASKRKKPTLLCGHARENLSPKGKHMHRVRGGAVGEQKGKKGVGLWGRVQTYPKCHNTLWQFFSAALQKIAVCPCGASTFVPHRPNRSLCPRPSFASPRLRQLAQLAGRPLTTTG